MPCWEPELFRRFRTLVESESFDVKLRDAMARARTRVIATKEIVTVPVEDWAAALPDGLAAYARCCRVSAYPPHASARVERHPNSHQRVLCLEGNGIIDVFEDVETTEVFSLPSKSTGPWEERWTSVVPNVWHQPRACRDMWIVVAFHTVLAGELIDEYR